MQAIMKKLEIDLDIAEIMLLSGKEYLHTAKGTVPVLEEVWWLQEPLIEDVTLLGGVGEDGWVHFYNVLCRHGVRPALKVRNLRAFFLNHGDKIEIVGHNWTVISDKIVLCDDIVGHTCFRKDHVYEAAEIKKWLEYWATENGIVINEIQATV